MSLIATGQDPVRWFAGFACCVFCFALGTQTAGASSSSAVENNEEEWRQWAYAAQHHSARREWKSAISSQLQAIALFERSHPDSIVAYDLKLNLGHIYREQSKRTQGKEAQESLEKAKHILSPLGPAISKLQDRHPMLMVRYLKRLREVYLVEKQARKVTELAIKELEIASRVLPGKENGARLLWPVLSVAELGDWEDALLLIEKGRPMHLVEPNAVLRRRKILPSACACLEKSASKLLDAGNTKDAERILIVISDMDYDCNQLRWMWLRWLGVKRKQKCLELSSESLKSINKVLSCATDHSADYVIRGELAQILRQQGRISESIAELQKAYFEAKKRGARLDQVRMLQQIYDAQKGLITSEMLQEQCTLTRIQNRQSFPNWDEFVFLHVMARIQLSKLFQEKNKPELAAVALSSLSPQCVDKFGEAIVIAHKFELCSTSVHVGKTALARQLFKAGSADLDQLNRRKPANIPKWVFGVRKAVEQELIAYKVL